MKKLFVILICFFTIGVCPNSYSQTLNKQNEQDEQDEQAIKESEFVPPKLIEYVQAQYPPKAFSQGVEAQVVAILDVDELGLVTSVEIEDLTGNGFDDAATDAMYQFVFEPATKNGEPISSRVLYRYTFFIEQKHNDNDAFKNSELENENSAISNLKCTLEGQVFDMDGAFIEDASVILIFVDDFTKAKLKKEPEDLIANTDASGSFVIDNLSTGTYQVDVIAPGYKQYSTTEVFEEVEKRTLIYRLNIQESQYETVVRGRRPPREVTRREISRREITRIPGTGGDALRAIQNLPGMARAPGLSGALIVRGSAPGDSRYFFDQLPVPLLYHFGGLTSVVNSDLLERIDFYPGNYSVRYGGATGGIIDVYPRAPKTDKLHASVDADFWDISALVETPITKDWSIAVSARRSYIDGILNAIMPADSGMQFTVAPRYYDYQMILDYHPVDNNKDHLRFFFFGSDDKMIFLFGDSVSDNPNFNGNMQFSTTFHQMSIKWEHQFSKNLSNQMNFGTGYWGSDSTFGDNFAFISDAIPIFIRDELQWKPSSYFILRSGIDAQIYWSKWKVKAPMMMPSEGENQNPISANDENIETTGKGWYYWPAWYGEFELTALENWRFIYGLRVGWFDQIEKVGIDPRFVVRYKIFEDTVLKGGMGLFHQPPDNAKADVAFGNKNLNLIGAVHYSLGVEQKISDNIEVTFEGFYKDMFNLVVSSDELLVENGMTVLENGVPVAERYNNDGTGKVYGLEFLLKHQPTERFFGWISYTLMKSSRINHQGEQERPFDFDQTHILTLVASAVLGRGWEAGLRYRLVSGNPDTPVSGSAYDADSDIYWPFYGQTNSDRLPLFHQLDIRIDKKWQFKHLKFAVYIDIQNVYNQKNVEGYQYSYDSSHRVYFYGLPILPSLGLKFEY